MEDYFVLARVVVEHLGTAHSSEPKGGENRRTALTSSFMNIYKIRNQITYKKFVLKITNPR